MKKYIIILLSAMLLSSGCEDYLEVKPEKDIVIPKTLKDFRALLDAPSPYGMNNVPALQLLGTDDFEMNENGWNSLSSNDERNAYIWNDEIAEADIMAEWQFMYSQVFYANIVIDGLEDYIPDGAHEQEEKEQIYGSALFYRANAFYHLVEMFAAPYDLVTAAKLPGIPLRTTSNINTRLPRASIQEVYDKIITDLKISYDVLPQEVVYKTRPSKVAALALLSKVYFTMEDYELAEEYAARVISIENYLLDFSTLDHTNAYPIPALNEEIIFYSEMLNYSFFRNKDLKISGDLYNSYEQQDLRKMVYFTEAPDGTATFKGSYTGAYSGFGGLAVDEIFFILAESMIRNDDYEDGMAILNEVLETRWQAGDYNPLVATSKEEALDMVLYERRKELIFRGTRWSDLRRLNKDPRYAKTLTRELDGKEYTLPPNDYRYTFLIPRDEITMNGIQQNPR